MNDKSNKQIKGYRTTRWRELRKEIFSRDNYCCTHCGKQREAKDLQLHHLMYLDGKDAWDYPYEVLTTYCKRCHAEEHGKIKPSSGWDYLDFDDLGDLIGECEYCHTDIRYEHHIIHPKWGELIVGSQCADKLTNTNMASKKENKRKRYANRMKTFIQSSRWKRVITKNGCKNFCIKQDDYYIKIRDYGEYCKIGISFYHPPLLGYLLEGRWIDLPTSEKQYKTLDEAKIKVFEIIENGNLDRYVRKVFLPDYYKRIEKSEEEYWNL